jgi:hypothetical protein
VSRRKGHERPTAGAGCFPLKAVGALGRPVGSNPTPSALFCLLCPDTDVAYVVEPDTTPSALRWGFPLNQAILGLAEGPGPMSAARLLTQLGVEGFEHAERHEESRARIQPAWRNRLRPRQTSNPYPHLRGRSESLHEFRARHPSRSPSSARQLRQPHIDA